MKTFRDRHIFKKKAQSLIEYSLILGIVAASLMAMQVYMKRGIQAAVQFSADQLGPQQGQQVSINFRRQTNTVSNTNSSRVGGVGTQVFVGGGQEKSTNITSTSRGTSTSISTQQLSPNE